MADSYLSISDAYLKAFGGHKGTREQQRSYSGYAGRHCASPQQLRAPSTHGPVRTPSKLKQRAVGEAEVAEARTMIERLVLQRIAQHENGTASPSSRCAAADSTAVSMASDCIARAAGPQAGAAAVSEAAAHSTPTSRRLRGSLGGGSAGHGSRVGSSSSLPGTPRDRDRNLAEQRVGPAGACRNHSETAEAKRCTTTPLRATTLVEARREVVEARREAEEAREAAREAAAASERREAVLTSLFVAELQQSEGSSAQCRAEMRQMQAEMQAVQLVDRRL